MNPQRTVAHIVDAEHGHVGQPDEKRAHARRVEFHRGSPNQAGVRTARFSEPLYYAADAHTPLRSQAPHKAQGATVDRCYVLADETLTREHAYTALSRGRHGNELFIVAPDRRTDERHAVEVEPDPLDAVRHSIARTGAKRMALDQREPQITSLEQGRAERDGIRGRLGHGPPDPSFEYRQLCEAITGARHWRDNARWRLDNARRSLDDLGPIGRITHRSERHDLEHRIDNFAEEFGRHEQQLADLEQRRSQVEPRMRTRERWEAQHGTELRRLDTLNRQIDITERLDQVASRTPEHGMDHGIDIGM